MSSEASTEVAAPPDAARPRRLLTPAILLVVVAVGLIGAFVGLGQNSYWLDELFTTWVVAPRDGFVGLVSRIVSDAHPPLYYLIAGGWAALFGTSEAALRSLSAIFCTAAIILFLFGLPRSYSWSGRLFAAAIALKSDFWLRQSQDARNYSLSLLAAAGLFVLLVRLSERKDNRWPLMASLFALMIVSSFVHFYLFLLSVAILGCLLFLPRREPLKLLGMAAFLTLSVGLYVKLVIYRHCRFTLTDTWIKNNAAWYARQLSSVFHSCIGRVATAFLLVSGLTFLARRRIGPGRWPWQGISRRTALVLLPPVGLLLLGVASSVIVTPNFTDRNFMICAPFVWGLLALSYDWALGRLGGTRRIVHAGLVIMAALGVLDVAQRLQPTNEDWRASANYVAQEGACQGQSIPVVSDIGMKSKDDFADNATRYFYSYYLAKPVGMTLWPIGDLASGSMPGNVLPLLQARSHAGCPVLLWGVHTNWTVEKTRVIARAIGRRLGARIQVVQFHQSMIAGRPNLDAGAFVFVRG